MEEIWVEEGNLWALSTVSSFSTTIEITGLYMLSSVRDAKYLVFSKSTDLRHPSIFKTFMDATYIIT
jgi:hypothetical protein